MGKFEYYPKSKAECIECPDRDRCDAQTSHLILVDCKSFYYTYNLLEPYNRMPKLTGNEEQCSGPVKTTTPGPSKTTNFSPIKTTNPR